MNKLTLSHTPVPTETISLPEKLVQPVLTRAQFSQVEQQWQQDDLSTSKSGVVLNNLCIFPP